MTEATSYARLAKNGNIYAQYESRDPTSSTVSKGEDFERVTTEVCFESVLAFLFKKELI